MLTHRTVYKFPILKHQLLQETPNLVQSETNSNMQVVTY